MTPAVPLVPELTQCDRETITHPDRIQAFGFLLAVSPQWTIVRASANLGELLGIDAADAIGRTLDQVITPHAVHDLRNRLMVLHGSERLYGVPLRGDDALFDVALHHSGDLLILEGEPSGPNEGVDAASLVRTMIARLDTMKTLPDFHRDCARQIRALTGFGRVMVYRFDDDGSGEVLAESMSGAKESFLGLHFPATDIPLQARALYLRNPFRVIGDVQRPTVPLLAEASASPPAPLDLSLAVTRAVSPVHLEYLRNMGVAASLSISIIVEGRLWGLIACHHDEPRVPRFVRRSAGELFGQMYSMMLESRLRNASRADESDARRHVERLISIIAGDREMLGNASWMHTVLRDAIDCDGLAVSLKGVITTSGLVPSSDAIGRIVDALRDQASTQVFATHQLASRFARAMGADSSSAGLLSIPLSLAPRDYLMLFRQRRSQTFRWGGDPTKAKLEDQAGVRISPRKSFAAFTVLRDDESLPFDPRAQSTAEMIRAGLIDVVFRLPVVDDEHGLRVFERQELLIAELNHRVRNILSLIRGLINRTATESQSISGYVESLNGRVQALARAHDQVTRASWGPGRLGTLFEHEIGAYVPTQPDRFRVFGPEVHLVPQAFSTMALVIHELVTNSLKYGALAGAGFVEVLIERPHGDGLRLAWREKGGPPVVPPVRRGFGSAIIERTIPFDLKGSVDVRYAPSGLEVDLSIPEAFIWSGEVPPAAASTVGLTQEAIVLSERPLSGLHVLLLEDNLIVALETEDLLRQLGATSVEAVSSIEAAREVVARSAVGFAVLDIHVGNETSYDFAGLCARHNISFIFASGYDSSVALDETFSEIAVVRKPYQLDDVAAAVSAALLIDRLRAGASRATRTNV